MLRCFAGSRLPGIYLESVSSLSYVVAFAFYVEQGFKGFFKFFDWFHKVFISCKFGFEEDLLKVLMLNLMFKDRYSSNSLRLVNGDINIEL